MSSKTACRFAAAGVSVVHAIAQLGVRIQRSNDHLYGRARQNINPLHNWSASLSALALYVADMFGAAVVFLFLGSVGAFGLLLVLALMPETREAPAATYFRAAGQD